MNNSSTFKMEEHLMLLVERIQKHNQLLHGRDTMEPTRNGPLFIWIKLIRFKIRD
jgi:hypothetical protein